MSDPYARARLYWSQSRLLAEQGKSDLAELYARQTLETLRTTQDSYGIARALETLAHICLELGKPSEALELLDEGESLMRDSGNPPDIAHFQLERARALAAIGDREQAAALALGLAGQLGEIQPVARGRAYLLLADLFNELGDDERARELYELAIACLEEQPPSKHLIAAYQALGSYLKAHGDRDAALELFERALAAQARTANLPNRSKH